MYIKYLGLTLAVFYVLFVMESQQAEVLTAIKKQIVKMHARCANFTGVEASVMEKATQEFKSEKNAIIFPNDQRFKCFLHCMFDRFGLVDSQHFVHIESLIEVLPEEFHEQILNLTKACGAITDSNECDSVFAFVNCCFKHDAPFLKAAVMGFLG